MTYHTRIADRITLGNEAIAMGVVENGCSCACSYPGTPASEILSAIVRLKSEHGIKDIHVEWSVNEKSAFEVALTNSYMGGRSCVSMKQVGLNVASDSLMSAAYTGVNGGFIIVSADDPGPHSSQTEQDSRFFAMLAKLPVFDPSSPSDARAMVPQAYALSEQYGIPVMIRPVTRVCHARQNLPDLSVSEVRKPTGFIKEPSRWAATPRFRYMLHNKLNEKLYDISIKQKNTPYNKNKPDNKRSILSSGVAFSYLIDLLTEKDLISSADIYKMDMPYPVSRAFLDEISGRYDDILVLEETYPVMEYQFTDRSRVKGKLNGFVPSTGELTPDTVNHLIIDFFGLREKKFFVQESPGKRPSLCPGCPHRASFYAVRTALPEAVYPGDIGCYTLGINLGAVDTCLCMGASINQAAGFFHSLTVSDIPDKPAIVATIGDSTFVHSGTAALINAVYNNARFILMILDNSTTAMTGNQPTALTGKLADFSDGKAIELKKLLEGCGVTFIRELDPYHLPKLVQALKDAQQYVSAENGGIAVIIARHPCLIEATPKPKTLPVVSQECSGCQVCITDFECPAIYLEADRVNINAGLCTGCGVCVYVCPLGHIKAGSP